MEILAVGWLLSIIGLVWAYVRDRRSKRAQRELADQLHAIRDNTAQILSTVIGESLAAWAEEEESGTGSITISPAPIPSSERVYASTVTQGPPPDPPPLDASFPPYVGYADVDNDGVREMLVQHPVGAHSTILNVYGWRDPFSEIELLGQLHTSCPAGFHLEDVDHDGRVEVATVDVNWDTMPPGRGYANAKRTETLYRWDGQAFERLGPGVTWDPMGDQESPERLNELYAPPGWANEDHRSAARRSRWAPIFTAASARSAGLTCV